MRKTGVRVREGIRVAFIHSLGISLLRGCFFFITVEDLGSLFGCPLDGGIVGRHIVNFSPADKQCTVLMDKLWRVQQAKKWCAKERAWRRQFGYELPSHKPSEHHRVRNGGKTHNGMAGFFSSSESSLTWISLVSLLAAGDSFGLEKKALKFSRRKTTLTMDCNVTLD